jgi:Putative peptidoglycan binding domain/CHAP domain
VTSALEVLNIARSQLGVVEQPRGSNRTPYSEWYGLPTGAWCAMFVSWCFAHAGMPQPASTSKGFAYTPSGADWYKRRGRWSTAASVGDVVFFDFPGDGVNRISHVGIVEAVPGDGSIVTIEGNTSGIANGSQIDGGGVFRRARRAGIVGYGKPAYSGGRALGPAHYAGGTSDVQVQDLKRGDQGPAVKSLQALLNAKASSNLALDGDFGAATETAVKNYQRFVRLGVDGEVGPQTWRTLLNL